MHFLYSSSGQRFSKIAEYESVNAIFVIVGAACLLLVALLGLMIWALKNGQFEDLENPAHRILVEELHEHRDK